MKNKKKVAEPTPQPAEGDHRDHKWQQEGKTRYTINLDPDAYRGFDELMIAARRQLGGRVDKSEIVRALLLLAADNASLREQVFQEITEPALPPKPVRTTVDLVPAEHEALQQWANGAQPPVGERRVHGQQVIRALVRRLLADEQLAEQIEADLTAGRGALNLRT